MFYVWKPDFDRLYFGSTPIDRDDGRASRRRARKGRHRNSDRVSRWPEAQHPARADQERHRLQSQARMQREAARATLRAAGINGEDSAFYRLIIEPAYRGMSK